MCPAEAFNPNSSTFRRKEFIGSEFWDTQPWTFFSPQNSNCSMSTFFSRPRAEVTSHHQHVDIGNECHKRICFQTCNHDTRNDVNHYMTMFFILSTIDKEFSTLVAGLAFRLFELFTSVCSFTFGTEEDTCSRWHLFASPTPFHIGFTASRGMLVRKIAIVSIWTKLNSPIFRSV